MTKIALARLPKMHGSAPLCNKFTFRDTECSAPVYIESTGKIRSEIKNLTPAISEKPFEQIENVPVIKVYYPEYGALSSRSTFELITTQMEISIS